MRVAANEPSWVRYVKEGKLEQAYRIYSHTTFFAGSFRYLPIRWLADNIGIWIFKLMLSLRLSSDESDTAVDLSTAFLLFWKRPDWVGAILLFEILKFTFLFRRLPLRASFWLTHWFSFQGRYGDCQKILNLLMSRVNASTRLYGEAKSICANFDYVIGNVIEASEIHQQSHRALALHGDKFFQVFNLGLWIRCAASSRNLDLMKMILAYFDEIDPEVPDERYGLKLLTYCSLVYFQNGRIELGERFLSSAQLQFSRSGSQLDRAIFCVVHSMILNAKGDRLGARSAIHQAQSAMKRYGRYRFYDDLILSLTKHLHGEKLSERESALVQGELPNSHPIPVDRLSDEIWYQSFFRETLRLYENYSELSLKEVTSVLERQTNASELTTALKDTNVHGILEPEFEFAVLSGVNLSQFRFSLWHQSQEYSLVLKTPFLPWRNSGIVDAIKSIVLSLQSVSYQEANRRIQQEVRRAEELKDLSLQVYHDIGSPIAALSMVFHACPQIPPDSQDVIQMAIQRIKNITRDLVTQHSIPQVSKAFGDIVAAQEVIPLVESVMAEKRLQHRSKSDIRIVTKVDTELTGVACAIQSTEFQRVISNLIDNGVEAIESCGEVSLRMSLDKTHLRMTVTDSGRGIPERYLSQLGKKRLSFGKPDGSGLGLYHAKKTIDGFNGMLGIESREGEGTSVTIRLPICTIDDSKRS